VYWYLVIVGTFALALAHVVPSIRNLVYVRVLFEKRHRTDRTTRPPRVAVFVPCKGTLEELADNLEAIAGQEYEEFTVTFISESLDDPESRAIERVVRGRAHCRHVVAGLATSCAQKNHNLLKGLARDSGSEVFVFCDSDTRPPRKWLSMLVSSLTEDGVPVATGFCWITPARRTLAGTLHSMMVAYQAAFISNSWTNTVWGGATAIRADTFERLDVADEWGRTVVDDMTLSRLLRRNGISVLYDPRCLVVSNNAVSSVREVLHWITRQILYLKFYLKPFWLAALAGHVPTSLLMMAAGPLMIASIFYEPVRSFGLVCLAFSLVVILAHTSLKLTCRDGQSALRWFVLCPLVQCLSTYCLIKSAFMRNVRWGDATYRLDRGGRVVAVERTGREGRRTPGPDTKTAVLEEDNNVQ
jgi:GT2 family glycosyltransferase